MSRDSGQFVVQSRPTLTAVAIAVVGTVASVGAFPSATSAATGRPAKSAPLSVRPAVLSVVGTVDVARAGVPYLARVPSLAGSGTWRAMSGSLPPGLSFDPLRAIMAGVPSRPGSFTVVFEHDKVGTVGSPASVLVRVTVQPAAVPAATGPETSAATGAIAGNVSSPAGAVVHGCVEAVSATGVARDVLTSTSGSYAISGLAPGRWEVSFSGCGQDYLSQWWPAQPSQVTAQAVVVTAGAVRGGVSAVLSEGGEISGVVTAAGSTGGLKGEC